MNYTTHNTDLTLLGMLVLIIVALVIRKIKLRVEQKRMNQMQWRVWQTAVPVHTPGTKTYIMYATFSYPPLDHQRDWPGWLD